MRVEFRINIKRNFKALFSKVDRDWAKRNVNFVNLSIERKVYGKYFQNSTKPKEHWRVLMKAEPWKC